MLYFDGPSVKISKSSEGRLELIYRVLIGVVNSLV